jgi:hypothetical protein
MPIQRRWTADDIVKLRSMAQKYPTALIAAALGRGVGATAVKAHQLKLSLRMKRGQVQASAGKCRSRRCRNGPLSLTFARPKSDPNRALKTDQKLPRSVIETSVESFDSFCRRFGRARRTDKKFLTAIVEMARSNSRRAIP